MYVITEDSLLIRTEEVKKMREEYVRRFGKRFLAFNYADFQGTEEMPAGQEYINVLRKCLEENKPCDIVSRRYDHCDH